MTTVINKALMDEFRRCVPILCKEMHKGQSGKVAVVGGSAEYTGAPYFTAMSSLRVGADLSYVLTTDDAAPVIKSYSPELIVLPILDSESSELEIRNWMSKMTSLACGPGLGRSDMAFKSLRSAVNAAKSKDIPIVIDADGLFVLAQDYSIVKGYDKCVLTPNYMEFKRLYEGLFKTDYDEKNGKLSLEDQCKAVKRLASELRVTVMRKGSVDIISDGKETVLGQSEGSLKRCGGIGDLLTGTIATFLNWTWSNRTLSTSPSVMAACAGSQFIRDCSHEAYKKHARSLLATDIIAQIPERFASTIETQF